MSNARNATIEVAYGRVVGVRTTDGKQFGTDAALLAAGASFQNIVAERAHRIPGVPLIGRLIRTKSVAHNLGDQLLKSLSSTQ